MANGIPTAPGGLLKGITTGLNLINSLETGRARTEERAKRGRDETRAEAKAERDALLTQIKAAGNVLKVGDLPDEIYFDNVDIIFSNTSKLMGKAYPGMDGYHKGLKDDAIALDKLRAQYQAGKINKNTYFKGALAISKNVFADPTKKERFDRGLKTADEERGILLRQEARAWLEDLQKPEGEQHKIKELTRKGHENPQWGGRLAEEVDKLKKENRAALLPGTGYKTTDKGIRVMDTKEGIVALIEGKQVPYDKTKHGLEKEKLEPGDEKYKILISKAFAADLEKAFRILRLRESGETKDSKGNPLPTEREVRDRMINLYPPIHKDIDDMLREDGSGEMTLTVGGKTFKLK